jgi:hypothetical protein
MKSNSICTLGRDLQETGRSIKFVTCALGIVLCGSLTVAVKFILLYDGSNPGILQLLMRLMCWDVDIVHRTNNFLVDADYWSWLNADLCYDPTFRKYLQYILSFLTTHPLPTALPMKPENKPYYCGPRVHHLDDLEDADADVAAVSLLTMIVTKAQYITPCLANYPIQFGTFTSPTNTDVHQLYNLEFPVLAFCAACFSWAIYLFNSGYFASTISMRNLLFDVMLACDPYAYGHALFAELTRCQCILPSVAALLDHVCGSREQGLVNRYLIHSHCYQSSEPTNAFWSLQASIIGQIHIIQKLRLFVAFVHPDHDGRSVFKFVTQLSKSGWVISSTKCYYPDYGDSVVGTTTIIVGVHTNTQATVDKLMFRTPPSSRPLPISNFVWQPFNKKEFSLSFSKDNSSFNDGSEHALHATTPSALVLPLLPQGLHPLYYLHLQGSDATILNGAAVMSLDSLCPPFDGSPTTNLFKCHFGIEFHDNNHTYVRPFLPFEFTSCFGFIDQLQYRLSQHGNWFALDAGIPSLMSAWVFGHVLERLLSIHD